MVAPDCSIPLLHETYPGNRLEVTIFRLMMGHLKSRYESITGKKTEVTIVFDRVNNSEDNVNYLEPGEFPLYYVKGLRLSQIKELFDVPHDSYVPLAAKELEGQYAYRTELQV